MTKTYVNPLALILVLFAVVFFIGCSGKEESSTAAEEVFLDDKNKTASNSDEVVISNQDVTDQSISNQNKKPEDFAKTAPDGSKINTAFDKFGNKTETRCFNNPRIKCLVVNSFADGRKEVVVYGLNGLSKNLPPEMIDKALTAPADEVANSVKIYAAFKTARPISELNSNISNSNVQTGY